MGWDAVDGEMTGGKAYLLSDEGESVVLLFTGEPFLLRGKFKGSPVVRAGFPVIGLQGAGLFIANKSVYAQVKNYRDKLDKQALKVTRHGAAGSTDTSYLVAIANDEEAVALSEFEVVKEEVLQEAVAIAETMDYKIER